MMYERQMESWVDHWDVKSHRPTPDAQALDVEGLIRTVHEARGVDPSSIKVFPDGAQPVQVELDGKPPSVLYLDAYSGVVIGEPSRKIRQFFQKVIAWHLALGVSGAHRLRFRTLISGANLVALFLAGMGILLWIPRRWTWQQLRPIIMFRSGVAGRARDFNWHNVIGIWSAVPLLIILWTGMAMSYGWARHVTDRAIGAANSEWLEWHGRGGTAFVTEPGTLKNGAAVRPLASLDALLARAKTQTHNWKAITIVVPDRDSKQVYFTIDMRGDGISSMSALGLDRAGKVMSFVPAGSGGISSPAFIRYGHTGEAWGIVGQTIAGAASLGGAVLVWTGVALSLRRLRFWLHRRAAPAADKAAGEATASFRTL
jgi:uncharacterized iron-regulated membrane protein